MTEDTALALTVAAFVAGIVGWTFGFAPLTVAAFVLLLGALGLIACDGRSERIELAATAGAILIAGLGVAVLGYLLDSTAVSFGGYAVAVVAAFIGAGELWAARAAKR